MEPVLPTHVGLRCANPTYKTEGRWEYRSRRQRVDSFSYDITRTAHESSLKLPRSRDAADSAHVWAEHQRN
jgi:hypothetical protein